MPDAKRLTPSDFDMDRLVALAKNRGFVYSGSEIYGGLANAWGYRSYGSALCYP